jgi:hypothetical protein
MRRSNTTFDLLRRFTIQALENCDLLVVPINDLIKMKFEFPKYFTELFKNAKDKLRKDFIDKVEVIQDHEKEDKEEHEKDQTGNLKSRFAYAFLGRLINKLKNNNDGNSPDDNGLLLPDINEGDVSTNNEILRMKNPLKDLPEYKPHLNILT